MLFDGPFELPIATLRPTASDRRRAVLCAELSRWLSRRWAWIRPRTIPLLVAFAGLLATLAAAKYVSAWSYSEPLQLVVHTRVSDTPIVHSSESSDRTRCMHGCGRRTEPVRILIKPIAPTDRYLELTIGGDEPR